MSATDVTALLARLGEGRRMFAGGSDSGYAAERSS